MRITVLDLRKRKLGTGFCSSFSFLSLLSWMIFTPSRAIILFFCYIVFFSPFILLPIPIYFLVIVSSFTIFSDWRECLKMAGWDGWAGGPVCWL